MIEEGQISIVVGACKTTLTSTLIIDQTKKIKDQTIHKFTTRRQFSKKNKFQVTNMNR